LYLWHGGMSFHGGALGVIAAIFFFTRTRDIAVLAFSDIICAAVPIGLFFCRIANFIYGELIGRPGASWANSIAIVYPGEQVPRYPSQLFEALCEGLLLFLVLFAAERGGARRHPGILTGLFLAGYAVARMSGELFREPDVQLGFIPVFDVDTTM